MSTTQRPAARTHERTVRLAGLGIAGAAFLLAKGIVRSTTGDDPSFIPAYVFLTGFGVWALAEVVTWTGTHGRTTAVGKVLAAVASTCGLIGLIYVVTGTIPETPDAPAAVGLAYGVGAAATYLGQFLLGVAAVRARALPGRLRWVPLGVVILQFPVFIIAGAIGDTVGREALTDGLGMALTAVLWAGSSAVVLQAARRSPAA